MSNKEFGFGVAFSREPVLEVSRNEPLKEIDVCPRCNGDGHFHSTLGFKKEIPIVKCPDCDGSGKKSCLLKKGMLKMNDLKNEIKIAEAEVEADGSEMMRRDQFATMRQLQVQKEMKQKDADYMAAGIRRYETFLAELEELPLSQAGEGIIGMVKKQIEAMTNQISASNFPRHSEVTLAAFEALFAEPEVL